MTHDANHKQPKVTTEATLYPLPVTHSDHSCSHHSALTALSSPVIGHSVWGSEVEDGTLECELSQAKVEDDVEPPFVFDRALLPLLPISQECLHASYSGQSHTAGTVQCTVIADPMEASSR
jgi:hypothetical protein